MPAFGQVLFDTTEGTHTQLPPDIRCIFFFDQKHLPQSLDFLLHLCGRKPHPHRNILLSGQEERTMWTLPSLCLHNRHGQKSCATFASSVRRWSTSSSVRSEGESPFSVTLLEKFIGGEAPLKPEKRTPSHYSVLVCI